MIKLFKNLADGLIAVASFALLILAVTVAADVLLRNAGIFYIAGVTDYLTIAQLILTCCAIPAAFISGNHLVVEIGTYGFDERHKARLEAVWLLLAAPLFILLGKLVVEEGLHMASRGRSIGVLGWSPNTHHLPVAAALFACAGICLAVGVVKARGRLRFLQAKF